jgi:hypothetical protein
MRKILVISIPILTLALFVVIMLSGNYLKKPLDETDNIPELIQILINNIDDEKWEEAKKNTDKLSDAWDRIVKRVQISSERDEINGFSMNVARLRGSIMAKNKANSLSVLFEAYEHWKELGN